MHLYRSTNNSTTQIIQSIIIGYISHIKLCVSAFLPTIINNLCVSASLRTKIIYLT